MLNYFFRVFLHMSCLIPNQYPKWMTSSSCQWLTLEFFWSWTIVNPEISLSMPVLPCVIHQNIPLSHCSSIPPKANHIVTFNYHIKWFDDPTSICRIDFGRGHYFFYIFYGQDTIYPSKTNLKFNCSFILHYYTTIFIWFCYKPMSSRITILFFFNKFW